ncbi:DgyrCDS7522 [Dimorphilus gyrociliatus]|uniref:DgyrCDS7522 n=1 Tax=Dimorphilus gyrociliatus TaxID=2664684 RepID=A0A7I8VTH5_9ANNE|nr:DgyrCDS7522 [Dimorphilus gyrociliatus]
MIPLRSILTVLPFIVASCLAWQVSLDHHHNYEEVMSVLRKIHLKCPKITHQYNLTGETVEGRKLGVLVISDNPKEHEMEEPEFKYIGNMHGNEVTGREILLKWLDELCERYNKGDTEVVQLINSTRIHVMPTMNPDGWEIANRQKGVKSWTTGRQNANNIDLNRNFPDLDKKYFNYQKHGVKWNNHLLERADMIKGLQPETKMVIQWILNNPFVLSANFHNGDFVANYPFDESRSGRGQGEYTPSPDDILFRDLALTYAGNHKVMASKHEPCMAGDNDFYKSGGITNGAEWYSLHGGMQDFNYLASNCLELTLEIGCEKFPPASKLPKVWDDNRKSMYEYLKKVHSGIKGRVFDKVSGLPIEDAAIKVTDLDTDYYIAHDILTNKDGEYWRLLVNGTYSVTAVARGYESEEVTVKINNDGISAKKVYFKLQPAAELDKVEEVDENNAELQRLFQLLEREYQNSS